VCFTSRREDWRECACPRRLGRRGDLPRSWLGAIGLLHEFTVDRPGGFEFLGGSAQFLSRFEELPVEFGDAAGEVAVGEFGEHALGEELVGDEVSTLGLGETVVEGPELPGEAVVLGAGVLQFGTKRCAGYPCAGARSPACLLAAWAALSSMSALRSGWS
jgi:hypothetical protein